MRTSTKANDDGTVATEYAIMASLIAVVIVSAVTQLGERLLAIFSNAAALV